MRIPQLLVLSQSKSLDSCWKTLSRVSRTDDPAHTVCQNMTSLLAPISSQTSCPVFGFSASHQSKLKQPSYQQGSNSVKTRTSLFYQELMVGSVCSPEREEEEMSSIVLTGHQNRFCPGDSYIMPLLVCIPSCLSVFFCYSLKSNVRLSNY